MKVIVQNKKGLNKDLKIFVEKKIIDNHLNEKYEEVSKTVQQGVLGLEKFQRSFKKTIW